MSNIDSLSTPPRPSALPLPWLPVLMYHRVTPYRVDGDPYSLCVTVAEFAAQMRWLNERGYQAVRLEDLAPDPSAAGRPAENGGASRSRQVVITFDDGYLDVFLHALPVLTNYGFTANVFLVGSYLGDSNGWDRTTGINAPLLGRQEVQALARHGFSFGSHSLSHRPLTHLGHQEAWKELRESKLALEDALGMEVRTFSFPYGLSHRRLQQMAQEAGYVAACGIEQRQHTLFNVSRIDASGCHGADLRWRLRVSGLYFGMRRSLALRSLKAALNAARPARAGSSPGNATMKKHINGQKRY